MARKFNLNRRYIDDLFVANFPEFKNHIYEIYPRELEIKLESNNPKEISYLDLHIVSQNSNLIFTVYDKREDFNFEIVNFPFMDSCIPRKSALGVYYSQLIRYLRLNTDFLGFKNKCKQLANKLLNQGYLRHDLKKISSRFFINNLDNFSKYDIRNIGLFLKEIW